MPDDQARGLLNNAANIIWERVKARLLTLDRQSVVERAIGNDYAIYRDRATWQLTAAALLSLYEDQADVIAGANQREGQRGLAALASRVIAEMAVCVSPVGSGSQCSTADLDYLVANVSILLECSSQSDAIHYRLSSRPLVIEPNGTFTFDTTFHQALHAPYMHSHGERGFRAAAASYGDAFNNSDSEVKALDPKYETAFLDEFGLSPRQLMEFTFRMADIAVGARRETFVLFRSEVEEHLKQLGVAGPSLASEVLTLKPRARWDDPKPKNAKPRDWYPWRFNRRLSLMRRALVQLEDATDPRVLIAPALLDRSVEYLIAGSYAGRLPVELFASTTMRAWIGSAVDKEGHEFNHDVAARFKELGFEARPDVKLTELGGTPAMGDVDVLAWKPGTGIVFATECKRLLFARTVAEIGERLQEYTVVAAPGEDRTPIQKHVDRISFLRTACPALSRITGIPADKIVLRSALVTDYLVPMQFLKDAGKLVDVIVDISLLDTAI